MMLDELLLSSRSYRRFHQDHLLDENLLKDLVQLTRLCPSAANRQPLKYMLSWLPEQNARIFPHLGWAAALTDWPGPAEGERPGGYIVILGDTTISRQFDWDSAIAAQTMILGAVEQSLGGCIIGSIDRVGLRRRWISPRTSRSCWWWPWASRRSAWCWKMASRPRGGRIGVTAKVCTMFPNGPWLRCWLAKDRRSIFSRCHKCGVVRA